MSLNKRIFFSLVIFFFVVINSSNKCGGIFSLYAQSSAKEMIIPMVKTPFPVHGATWSKNSSTFAYTEENNIIVRDGNEYSLIQTIPTYNGNLRFMQFTQYTEGEGDQLATLSAENTLEIRILPEEQPFNQVQIDPENFPTAMAYNWNGNYLATADTGRAIYIYMQNYLTETLIERKSEVLSEPATSLNFSRDNKYLAVGCEDNQIYVLDVSSGKVLFSMYYPNELNITPVFTHDNEHIIYPLKKKNIVETDFYGNIIRKIKTKYEIKSLDITPDGTKLVVCCKNNQFYYYDLATGKYLGYIPRYSQADLTCYAFNNDGSKLLEGFSDGCIYILDVEDVFLLPGELPPKFRLYVADDSTSLKGKNLSPNDLANQNMKGNRRPYFKSGHYLVLDTSFAVLPNPFTTAYSFGAGYKNYSLIKPFYFGGELEPFIGFPKDTFPFAYKVKGAPTKSPLLVGMKIYAPVGFSMKPLNNDLEVFGEMLLGTSLMELWNGKMGSESIASKTFSSFYIAAKVGAGWKFVNLSIRGEYDTILQFSVSANLGFQIKLPGG